MLGAFGEQAVEQHLIEPLGALQRLGDALHRVLVEVEARGAEGQVEVGDDDVGLQDLRHGPGGVVAHRAGADAALGADEGDDVADGIGVGIVVEVRQALDQLQRRDRSDQVLAHAALQQLTVEHDVVGAADHHHLGAGVAALREPVELGQHLRRAAGWSR